MLAYDLDGQIFNLENGMPPFLDFDMKVLTHDIMDVFP